MPQSKFLVDSGFLYALYDRDDENNAPVSAIAELYRGGFIIPYVVLTEAAFLFRRAGGALRVAQFLNALVKGSYRYEIVSPDDLARASSIMTQYANANLDFVDCCIMALSERLTVTQICTLDRRDFSMFRPVHCEYLELLP
jgi:predicted nucleic acid-binding protein